MQADACNTTCACNLDGLAQGGRASGGILCTLALFHLMMVSPKLLHTALGKGSPLMPSICALMQHVMCEGPAAPAPDTAPSAAKYKVGANGTRLTKQAACICDLEPPLLLLQQIRGGQCPTQQMQVQVSPV